MRLAGLITDRRPDGRGWRWLWNNRRLGTEFAAHFGRKLSDAYYAAYHQKKTNESHAGISNHGIGDGLDLIFVVVKKSENTLREQYHHRTKNCEYKKNQ